MQLKYGHTTLHLMYLFKCITIINARLLFLDRHLSRVSTNRSVSRAPCVWWAVTMPVMELYSPLPDQQSCTEGRVGNVAALTVNATGEGAITGTQEIRA